MKQYQDFYWYKAEKIMSKKKSFTLGTYLVLGIGLGVVFGVIINNTPMGIIIGSSAGLIADSIVYGKNKDKKV
jgi:F0F1-type ATP synthase assembly protein I